MPSAIAIEGLGKCYVLRHQQLRRHDSLRDLLAHGARRLRERVFRPSRDVGPQSTREVFWALRGIDLKIAEGARVGIVGRNGAGKSTLLKILSRITEPTEGRVKIRGRVSSLLEVGTGFHPELSGRENIFLNGAILGMSAIEIRRKFDDIVAFADIERFLDTPVKRYSSGMYVRLAFAVAAHVDPEVLIVDEVLAVGDLKFRQKCVGKMEDLNSAGRTLVFVSHDMSMVRHLCSKVVWMNDGRIQKYGDSETVIGEYEKSMAMDAQPVSSRSRAPVPSGYHIARVELRNCETGESTGHFRVGDTIDILLSASADAPQDGFGAEFFLYGERGDLISFGGSSPLRNVTYRKRDRGFRCKLGPIPLTVGKYHLAVSLRPWGMERWDYWDRAITFSVDNCDPYGTGFDVPNGPGGHVVINQDWSVF